MANLDFLNPQKMQRLQELINSGAAIKKDPMTELGNKIMGTVNPNSAILPVPKESMMPVPETAKQPEATIPVAGSEVEVAQPATTPPAQSQLEVEAVSQMNDTSQNDDMAELQNYLRQNQALMQPYIDAEKAGLAENEQTLKQLQETPKQVDLSALMGYADYLTGGNISKGYKAPMSEEERLGTIAKLQDMIQGQRRGITSSMAKSLQDKLYGAALLGKSRSDKTDARVDKRQIEKFATDLGNDTKVFNKELEDASAKLNKLETIYKGGDLRQITSILGDMATYIGGNKGATSDPDAARQLYETLEVWKTKMATKVGSNWKLDEKETASMVDLIQKSRDTARDIYKNKYGAVRDTYLMRSQVIGKPELMKDDSPAMKYLNGRINKADTRLSPMTNDKKYEETATNPQTGEKVGLVNGQWVPIK